MATTEHFYTGNGSTTTFAFTFPYLSNADVEIELDNVLKTENTSGQTDNDYTISNTNIVFNSAPGSGVAIHIYRVTNVDSAQAQYAAGSSIRAADLNNNQTQVLYSAQEASGQLIRQSDLKDSIVSSAKIIDGGIATVDIADSAITTAKINADAITGAKIADDQINSEHYVDGSIDTQHIADSQITSVKIADGTIVAGDLASNAVTTAKITDANVTTAKIADSNVTTAKIANSNVTTAKIADSNVTTAKIADSNVTTAKIAADNITSALIADDQINSEHYVDGSIDTQHIADSQITSAKIADGTIVTADLADNSVSATKIINAAVTNTKISADAVDSTKIADDSINSEHYVDGSIDTAHIAGAQVTDAKLASNSVTTSKITDANVTTVKVADANITLAKLASDLKQTTISNSDTQLPTSGAVVDYVAAQIAPIGGLEVIATEVAFPNTQPSAGVVISISDAGGVVVSGTSSNTGRTVGGSTVTINGFPSTLTGETITAGAGLMVSSTGSGQVYNYHKLLAKEADVKQLSDDINDFASRYRVGSSNPTSSLDNGDLFFNTGSSKLLVYNGTTSAWEETQSVGNFFINTISSYSGTGGNSASFNGSAYRFVLSSPGLNAEQHIVSINGVIQKPNSGTSQPSEGFAIDGSSIIFSSAPVSGADFFIITIGAAVSIGTPSNNTVSTDVLTSGAVTTVKIADDAVTAAKLANTAVTAASYGSSTSIPSITVDAQGRITAASGNTVNTDLVGDTSPQLGGDLASNGNDIDFADNDKAIFGAGSDLQIYHDGSHSRLVDAGTGYTKIQSNQIALLNADDSEQMAQFNSNGSVALYFNNVKKFESTNGGIHITGSVACSGGSSNNLSLPDNGKAKFGTSDDLQIYHDGTNSHLLNTTNALIIRSDALRLNDGGNTETMIKADANGAVELYFDNTKRFETTSTGIDVTGDVDVTDNIRINTNSKRFLAGASNQARMYHDGSDTYFDNTNNGHLYLYNHVSSKSIIFGTAGTNRAGFDSSGHFSPWANNTYDLGTTSERWRNIYTNDLNLSNEGGANDVDGTWGDWTIQEGESDLFLKNNRSGKKYKFNLTEVS